MSTTAPIVSTVKAGDLLYAVGPGPHDPHGPTDLRVYSAVVENVRLEGSYSASATPADLASATLTFELANRPVLGFLRGAYSSDEVGVTVHLSAADAIRAFIEHVKCQRIEALRALDRTNAQLTWAVGQANALATNMGVTP